MALRVPVDGEPIYFDPNDGKLKLKSLLPVAAVICCSRFMIPAKTLMPLKFPCILSKSNYLGSFT